MIIETSIVNIHKKNGIIPKFDIYMGRGIITDDYVFKKSKWSNPFKINFYGTLEECLIAYEIYIRKCIKTNPEYYNLRELIGKKLGCWCITTNKMTPTRCHCQILLKIMFELGYIENENHIIIQNEEMID